MVETGLAPHYTELASELGVTPEEEKEVGQSLNNGITLSFTSVLDYFGTSPNSFEYRET